MLVGCEMSGRVRDAFAARNWEAWSADLLPSESPVAFTQLPDASGYVRPEDDLHSAASHYQGDVRDLFSWEHPVNFGRLKDAHEVDYGDPLAPPFSLPLWDLFMGHPPCTHLSSAGARYWAEKRADGRQDAAAGFFMAMVHAPSPLTAVENPRGDMKRRYRPPDQEVEPFWFGDPLRKKTCLWLKGLPLLTADRLVEPEGRVATGGGSHRTDIAAGRGPSNGHEDSEGRARRHIVRSRTPAGFARAAADQWGKFAEEYYAARCGS